MNVLFEIYRFSTFTFLLLFFCPPSFPHPLPFSTGTERNEFVEKRQIKGWGRGIVKINGFILSLAKRKTISKLLHKTSSINNIALATNTISDHGIRMQFEASHSFPYCLSLQAVYSSLCLNIAHPGSQFHFCLQPVSLLGSQPCNVWAANTSREGLICLKKFSNGYFQIPNVNAIFFRIILLKLHRNRSIALTFCKSLFCFYICLRVGGG